VNSITIKSGIIVARIVKKLADRAGLDASKYSGHSLRAGHATRAAIAGASERSIMNQTGHRSVQMVRRYIREGSLFRENSAGRLGLKFGRAADEYSAPGSV
jgi:integrase